MINLTFARVTLLAAVAAMTGCDQPVSQDDDILTVYSGRKEHLVKPLFERFTADTGIEVRYITDGEGPILARLKAEGEQSPADVLITVDAGNLWHAAEENLLQPIESNVLEMNVPEHLQDPNNLWFGLSQRARVMVYNTERTSPQELTTYEALADEQWHGRLCLRTAKKVYNQSLVATLIEAHGYEDTKKIVEGWVRNLAADPFSNDTQAMQAVAAGACDVTLVNTYYFGRLENESPELPLAIFYPNQGEGERGIHVNVSGAGILKYAPKPELALQFIEWLSQDEAQYMFAELNQEFPVNPNVPASDQVRAWGDFVADDVNLRVAGQRQAEAIRLMDEAGYQ
ncbi:MAG: extracellular solute-binding protein [Gammaproteobacteria bacterium]|nr:extracellular solute-binding protein [Gammaproteobacteria bacterium]